MDRGGWQVTVQKVTKNLTRLTRLSMRQISDRSAITNAYIAMLPEVPIETFYCGFRGSFSLVISCKSLNRMNRYLSVSSVQFSRSVVSDSATWWIAARQASLSIANSRVYSNLCPSSRWCHPAISSSVIPFSSCLQSLPASGSSPMSQLFTWGGQSTGVSASASVLPMNTQDWSPLGWTGWISLQSKGLSTVFSNTRVQEHQFSSAQLSSQSNPHIHTWRLEKL